MGGPGLSTEGASPPCCREQRLRVQDGRSFSLIFKYFPEKLSFSCFANCLFKVSNIRMGCRQEALERAKMSSSKNVTKQNQFPEESDQWPQIILEVIPFHLTWIIIVQNKYYSMKTTCCLFFYDLLIFFVAGPQRKLESSLLTDKLPIRSGTTTH